MSKFMREVREKMLSRRKMLQGNMPLLEVNENMKRVKDICPRETIEYEIGVTYGAKIFCLPEDVPMARQNVFKELQEDIYGEFRKKLLELERLLFEHKHRECMEAIRNIMDDLYR